MAKKTHIKVRMVPESNPDSKFVYYAKKPTKGEKAKDKLKLKEYNPNTRKHEFFVEKNFLHTVSNLFSFFKISVLKINISSNHRFPYYIGYLWIYFHFFDLVVIFLEFCNSFSIYNIF